MKLKLLVPLLLACGAVAAEDSPRIRAVRYYAEGLERPLLQIRASAELIQGCRERHRKLCSKQQRESAGGFPLTTLLDALTLFPQRLDGDPAAGLTNARRFADRVGALSALLLSEAGEYDRLLFVRYGATLRACPDDGASVYLESLEELKRVEFQGFQAMDGDRVTATLESMRADEMRQAEALRQWPVEDCVAARSLGEYLMQLMNSKLTPWMAETHASANKGKEFDFENPTRPPEPKEEVRRARDRELAHAVAGNFVSVVATELQITAFPESEARLKLLADEVERSKQPE